MYTIPRVLSLSRRICRRQAPSTTPWNPLWLPVPQRAAVSQIIKLHQDLSRCHTMPTVFALGDLFEGPTITMRSYFYDSGEALPVCREVATSLTNWHGCFGKDRYHLSVGLLGTSEVMEAMATCLQDYCPRRSAQFRVIIHEYSIQVSSWLSRRVIPFIIA
jgi:hypothetical protein